MRACRSSVSVSGCSFSPTSATRTVSGRVSDSSTARANGCRRVKVPHIGWNTVAYPRTSSLFDGVPENSAFYFVHSYCLVPRDGAVVIGETEYGVRFAAAVQRGDTLFAVQFHPEKSSTLGLKVLSNFGRIAEEARA